MPDSVHQFDFLIGITV